MEMNEKLREMLAAAYGERVGEISRGLSVRRMTTFRANTLKSSFPDVGKALAEAGIAFSVRNGAFVVAPEDYSRVRALPIYERGEIYMQSLSSMLPPLLLGARAGESILDMCAAPGGKTSQIAALTSNGAFITACERDKVRAERLKHNLALLGVKRTSVLVTDASSLDPAMKFDRILLDAPCTGSGTITPSSPGKFSEKLLAGCVKAQKKLLAHALRLLKKGGTLVYSTCSLLPAENEDIVRTALGKAELVDADIHPEGASLLPALPGTLLVSPGEFYEGFCVACLRLIPKNFEGNFKPKFP